MCIFQRFRFLLKLEPNEKNNLENHLFWLWPWQIKMSEYQWTFQWIALYHLVCKSIKRCKQIKFCQWLSMLVSLVYILPVWVISFQCPRVIKFLISNLKGPKGLCIKTSFIFKVRNLIIGLFCILIDGQTERFS